MSELNNTSNKKPLRVLIIAPSLDILGGQAVQAARLLERLESEESLQIGFLPINPRLPGPLRSLQRIKYVRTLVTSLAYYISLLVTIRKFDVIHIFSASYLSFLLSPTPAILISKLYGKKSLLNYHSGEALDHLQRWSRTAIPTIKMANEVIVPSGYLVEVLKSFGIESSPIYNLIDTNVFTFRKRDPLQPHFLSNRNFEAHYGVDAVLNAFAIIQKQTPEATLIVVGDGPLRHQLRQLASDLELKNVTFTGRVEHEHATRLYDSADVFLNGSSIDNQPLSILEAFACGLPVVTTNAGGIPFMVTDEVNALLSPTGDPSALAKNALRLLSDQGLTNVLVENGLKECREYEWRTLREQWLATYLRLGGREKVLITESTHSNAKLEENQTA